MKIFYHTDLDGKCAGAIAYNYFREKAKEESREFDVECLPINYNDNFPFEDIQRNEWIIIVDFSLQKEGEFERLLKITNNIVWIDHHKTAIERHSTIALDILGKRDVSKSGCELTWEYFYDEDTPFIVKLLGDYDTWTFKYGEKTNQLQTGIRLYNTDPTDDNWPSWLGPNSKTHAHIMCKEGERCLLYRNNYYKSLIKAWSFPVLFEGSKCIACNAGCVSSQLFDSVEEDYDIMIPFVWDGKQWTISLYTKKDIDVSAIAKKYGGGGHKQAAGFLSKNLPWGEE